LGYIPTGLAAELAPIFDSYGLPVPATVSALINGSRPFTVRIRFIVPQPYVPDDPPLQVFPEEDTQSCPPGHVAKEVTGGDGPPLTLDIIGPEPLPPPADKTVPEPSQPQPDREPDDDTLGPPENIPDLPREEDLLPALPSRNGHIQEVMDRAAAELRWLEIQYCDNWGNVTLRRVLPLSPYLSCEGLPGYQCWCALRKDFRTFLSHRVIEVVPGKRLSPADEAYSLLTPILSEIRLRLAEHES
jgi:hypothetical protein